MSLNPALTITGAGAVSPAGWGLPALAAALAAASPLPATPVQSPGQQRAAHAVHSVPRPLPNRQLAGHPRLRRASPIAHFAAAAALEALGDQKLAAAHSGALRLGLIYALMNGCVAYSSRFYGEVLQNPAVASPILFPETVFNAPASHLATFLGITGPVYTMVGDTAEFFSALDLATLWLDDGLIDACLVVGAEEADWLTAEALDLMVPGRPLAEGAGAILLENSAGALRVQNLVAQATAVDQASRVAAAQRVRAALGALPDSALLIDDLCGHPRTDVATSQAWQNWSGPRLAPAPHLGLGLGAGAAWQCALAYHALLSGSHSDAVTVSTGNNQHAAALHLRRTD